MIDQGRTASGSSSQFNGLLRSYREGDIDDADLDARLVAAVEHAKGSFRCIQRLPRPTSICRWLEPRTAVGSDRYARAVRNYLGSDIDPEETYRWGWSEVERLWTRLAEVAASVSADRTVAEVSNSCTPIRSEPPHRSTSSST